MALSKKGRAAALQVAYKLGIMPVRHKKVRLLLSIIVFVLLTKLDWETLDLVREAERRRNCRQQAQSMATRSYQPRDNQPLPIVNGQSRRDR